MLCSPRWKKSTRGREVVSNDVDMASFLFVVNIVLSNLELECGVDIRYISPSFIIAFLFFICPWYLCTSLSLFHVATILYGTY